MNRKTTEQSRDTVSQLSPFNLERNGEHSFSLLYCIFTMVRCHLRHKTSEALISHFKVYYIISNIGRIWWMGLWVSEWHEKGNKAVPAAGMPPPTDRHQLSPRSGRLSLVVSLCCPGQRLKAFWGHCPEGAHTPHTSYFFLFALKCLIYFFTFFTALENWNAACVYYYTIILFTSTVCFRVIWSVHMSYLYEGCSERLGCW